MQKLHYHQPGTPPATLVVPPGHAEAPTIRIIEYAEGFAHERRAASLEDVLRQPEAGAKSWIDISGLGDVELLRQVARHFHIHPLALEDVLSLGQRPHAEEYPDQIFVTLQMCYQDEKGDLTFEQVSLFCGAGYVISIQEDAEHDVFDAIRIRLREGRGNARRAGSDYLAYALIDCVVDHYFPIVEALGESIEDMQDELIEDAGERRLKQIREFRRALAELRRSIWPLREVIQHLMRDESGVVEERTKPFLRDCYDHVMTIMDLVESFREAAANFIDLYLSSISMRTSEVMRVLTVVSSIFIPLTFVVGLYGMNFDTSKSRFNMPELHWKYGYPAVLVLMSLVALVLILFFRRKRWL